MSSIFQLGKIHRFSRIYVIHLNKYICKSFSTVLDQGFRKNIKKKEIGEHKLNENESTEYKIEKVKQARYK